MANVCIKITCGGCGIKYTDAKGNPRHALMTPKDGPFDCEAAQAERLVRLGVAEYVSKPGVQIVENQTDGKDDGVDGVPKFGHLDVEQLEKMDYNDLKKLAADMGVKAASNKKADLIEALLAVEVEIDDGEDNDADDEDDDQLPNLNAADPE